MSRINELLRDATARLAALPDAEPGLEARLLLREVLGVGDATLIAYPERALEPVAADAFYALLARRLAGEPVAYLLGRRAFWSLELEVTPAVLIPRPETELLVEAALERIAPDRPLRLLDLGTGSGAIAAALARERPACAVIATDASTAALAVARANFRRLGLAQIEPREGAWYNTIGPDERLDLILSNPPYVRAEDPHLAQGDVAHEPRAALAAGADGLDALRVIVAGAPARLAAGGWLLVEHGFDQGAEVRALFVDACFEAIETRRDLAGHERVTLGRAVD